MKERGHDEGMKISKNIVYINGVNENEVQVVVPNDRVDQRTTTTHPHSGENKIYNYFVFEGRKHHQTKKAEKTEPKVEKDSPKEPHVSSVFFITIQESDYELHFKIDVSQI